VTLPLNGQIRQAHCSDIQLHSTTYLTRALSFPVAKCQWTKPARQKTVESSLIPNATSIKNASPQTVDVNKNTKPCSQPETHQVASTDHNAPG
jgi:hypothetical protein